MAQIEGPAQSSLIQLSLSLSAHKHTRTTLFSSPTLLDDTSSLPRLRWRFRRPSPSSWPSSAAASRRFPPSISPPMSSNRNPKPQIQSLQIPAKPPLLTAVANAVCRRCCSRELRQQLLFATGHPPRSPSSFTFPTVTAAAQSLRRPPSSFQRRKPRHQRHRRCSLPEVHHSPSPSQLETDAGQRRLLCPLHHREALSRRHPSSPRSSNREVKK